MSELIKKVKSNVSALIIRMPAPKREAARRDRAVCDFLGLMRIARVAPGDRIDLVDVPRDERGKGLLRIASTYSRNKTMSSGSCIYVEMLLMQER